MLGRTLFAASAFALALGLARPPSASACLHAGPGFAITQRSHEALAVVHDGREDLVLKIAYGADQPPSAIGMVIPVPNPPDHYAALEPGFFPALRRWVEVDTGTHVRGLGMGQRATGSVVELEPVRAGPYDIRPIQASGPEAVGAVRAWLEEHGFSTIPEAALAPFAAAGWTYLAVRVAPTGEDALADAAELPPLHLSFPTPGAVFPVRLEAQGTFPMWLYLATTEALPDDAFDGAVARGFQVAAAGSRPELPRADYFPMTRIHAFEASTAPPAVRAFLESVGDFEERSLYLRVLHARRFGAGRADPSEWTGALTIPEMPDAALVIAPAVAPEPTPEEPIPADEPSPESGEADEADEAEEAGETSGAPADEPGAAVTEDPAPPADEPSGCGCRLASRTPAPTSLVLLVVGLALWRRRARS